MYLYEERGSISVKEHPTSVHIHKLL